MLRDLVGVPTSWSRTSAPARWTSSAWGTTTCASVNPRLVYTALSGYGQTGPYRRRPAYDNSAQATGGLWSMNGDAGRPPIRVGTIIGDLSATHVRRHRHARRAAARRAHRRGTARRHLPAGLGAEPDRERRRLLHRRRATCREPMGNEHPFVQPYELFPCKDGFVFFGGYTDKFWRISCRAVRAAGGRRRPRDRHDGQALRPA